MAKDSEEPREYRPPKIPELGSEEARERIRRSGVPLDEWVPWPPTARQQAGYDAKHRRDELHLRIFCWLIGLAFAALFVVGYLTSDATPDPREDGYAICQDERGAYEC